MARLMLLAALLAGVLPAHAAEGDALERIRALLGAEPRLRAEFEQVKRMADLERPQVAQGRMLVWGDAGVIWEMDQPVKAAIVLREDTTTRIDARGRRTATRAEHDPAAARIGRVLRALLRGDAAALRQWFDIDARLLEGGRWSIALTPRKGPMAAFLKGMQVTGDRYAQAVTIDEANGDSTQIRFRNHRDALPLSEQERELLGVPG
jgi:hypothetical protein